MYHDIDSNGDQMPNRNGNLACVCNTSSYWSNRGVGQARDQSGTRTGRDGSRDLLAGSYGEPFTGFGGIASLVFYYLQNQKIKSLFNAPVKGPNHTVSNINKQIFK